MNPQPTSLTGASRLRGLSVAGLAAAALLLALWLMLGAAQPPVWAGGSYVIAQTYPNPDPAPVAFGGEEFGAALFYLSDSDKLIVGARSDQLTTTTPGGLAYVLDAATGEVDFVLSRTVPITGDWFGFSVTGVLTAVAVGAPKVDTTSSASNDGAVYLFDRSTGDLIFTYLNPQPTIASQFGSAVAILSGTIVVGAPQSNTSGGHVDLCSIVDGDCPTFIPNPSIGSPAGGDNFGLSLVAIPGGFAVGAPLDGSHGTVYLYDYDGVTATLSAVISTTVTGTGDEFGRSLALVGDKLLIGAAKDDTGDIESGVAYLYDLNGNQLHKFTNPNPHNSDHFGSAVSGDANLILIGASDDDQGAQDAGLIHIYANDGVTYSYIQGLGSTTPLTGTAFGFALAPLGGAFAVSALGSDLGAADAGVVYIVDYDANPPTPTATATATAGPGRLYLPITLRP